MLVLDGVVVKRLKRLNNDDDLDGVIVWVLMCLVFGNDDSMGIDRNANGTVVC